MNETKKIVFEYEIDIKTVKIVEKEQADKSKEEIVGGRV